MRTGFVIAIAAAAILAVGAAYMIDIDQTEEGALPEIAIEGGQMPEFEAEMGEIEITEETVTVPSLEITPPDADEEIASN